MKKTTVNTIAILVAIVMTTVVTALVITSCGRHRPIEDTPVETTETTIETTETTTDPAEDEAERLAEAYRQGLWDGKENEQGYRVYYTGSLEKKDIDGNWDHVCYPATRELLELGWATAEIPEAGLAGFRRDDLSALIIYRDGEEVNRVPIKGLDPEAGGLRVLADGNTVVVWQGPMVWVCAADKVRTGPVYTIGDVSDVEADYNGGPIKVATFGGNNFLVTPFEAKDVGTHYRMLPTSFDEANPLSNEGTGKEFNESFYGYVNQDGETYTLVHVYGDNKAFVITNRALCANAHGNYIEWVVKDGSMYSMYSFSGDGSTGRRSEKFSDENLKILGIAGSGLITYPIVSEEESNDTFEGYPVYNPAYR